MYEHLVKNVQHYRRNGSEVVTYTVVETGEPYHWNFAPHVVGAIETWLAQPKPPTARERAQKVVDNRLPQLGPIAAAHLVDDIAAAIEAAENAAREARE